MLSLASMDVKIFKAITAINECKLNQSIYTFRLQLYIWKYSKPWKIKNNLSYSAESVLKAYSIHAVTHTKLNHN